MPPQLSRTADRDPDRITVVIPNLGEVTFPPGTPFDVIEREANRLATEAAETAPLTQRLLQSPLGQAAELAAGVGALGTLVPHPAAQAVGRASLLALGPFGAARTVEGLRTGDPVQSALGVAEAFPAGRRLARTLRAPTPREPLPPSRQLPPGPIITPPPAHLAAEMSGGRLVPAVGRRPIVGELQQTRGARGRFERRTIFEGGAGAPGTPVPTMPRPPVPGTPGPPAAALSPQIEQRIQTVAQEMARQGRQLRESDLADLRRLVGAEEAARRTGLTREAVQDLTGTVSRLPMEAEGRMLDEAFRRLIKDKTTLIPLAIAGTAGLSLSDSDSDTLQAGLAAGTLGLLAGPVVLRLLARGLGGGQPLAERALYFSYLSSPLTIAKATVGSFTGALDAAAQLAMSGNRANAARILRELAPDRYFARYVAALKNPDVVPQVVHKVRQTAGRAEGLLGIPTRLIQAADYAGVSAMRAGGFSLPDAARQTLAGTPVTRAGASLLRGLQGQTRLMRGLPPEAQMLLAATTKISVPFPRVGVQIMEQGLRRSPTQILTATDPMARARGVIGTATILGGWALGDAIPAEFIPLATAAAGPAGLPFLAGLSIRKASEAGLNPLSAFTREIIQESPLPQFVNPLNPRILVPGIARDIGRALDPFARETRVPEDVTGAGAKLTEFARRNLLGNLPVLREQLPVRPVPTDVFGQPLAARESPVRRFLAEQPREFLQRRPDIPVIHELERLGIPIGPPQFRRTIDVGGTEVPIPPALAAQAQVESRRLLEPMLAELFADPRFQALSDEAKRVVALRMMERLNLRAANVIRRQLLSATMTGQTRIPGIQP